MATVNEKLTNLADQIRVLSGTSEAMGFDAMAENVSEANDNVATQTDLIAQIATALEGKIAGGGSGSGGGSVETCTVTIEISANLGCDYIIWYDGTNSYIETPESDVNEYTVAKDSRMYIAIYAVGGDIEIAHTESDNVLVYSVDGYIYDVVANGDSYVEFYIK